MQTLRWILKIVLALFFGAAAYYHGLAPREVAVQSAPWIADVSTGFRTFLGLVELAGAIGVLVPRTARLAAGGLVILMLCATAFHVSRGEPHIIWMNLCVAGLAAIVAGYETPRRHTGVMPSPRR